MLVQVAVPVPQLDLLTYRVPPEMPPPPVGARVVVPLGARIVTGIVVEVGPDIAPGAGGDDSAVTVAEAGLKGILRVLDAEAFVPGDVVELARWTAEYYIAGAGAAITAVLPPKTRGTRVDSHKTERVVSITDAGRAVVDAAPDAIGTRGPSQAHALLRFLATQQGVTVVSALAGHGLRATAVAGLEKKGLVSTSRSRLTRDPFDASAIPPPETDREATEEQAMALERLQSLVRQGGFHVAVLHGVTGSGKTEVYLRLARAVRAAGRGVLVLVPEIALTPAVAAAFRQAFGDQVAVQHSGLSDGERHDQWHRIRNGELQIVVGTRSAVFTPLANPGLIIVDEEHDSAYKQEESPRYHGRDVAIVRGQKSGALVVLGSATPSMETFHHAVRGKYAHVTLARRVLDRPLPSVTVVDMREEYAADGPDVIVSRQLRGALEERIGRGEQSLVLLNRRGFATAVFCRQCAGTIDCPNCSVSLVIHGEGRARRARCHYCNTAVAVPARCPACAAPYLEQAGFGTQRVEKDIADLFPGARVARLDRDAIRRRGALSDVLGRFRRGEIDVLIGTQMIAKGHDFPRVTLVGVISADVGLGMADFRASERTFQLLTQVAGRAGRGAQAGEAIIQTLYPEHYSIQLACRQDFQAFYEKELKFREQMHYPPRVALVNIVVRAATLAAAMSDAGELAAAIAAGAQGMVVLGPAPAPLARLRGQYRAQMLIKGLNRKAMRQAVVRALSTRPQLARRSTVDVDPLSVL